MSNAIPAAPGIYKITCTANKKIYVGSAINLRGRRIRHFNTLRRNVHRNRHLQRAWNKYGEQAFIFEVLELVLPISLTAREQYWFNKLKPFGRKGFNIAREAGSVLGIKRSPETREKLRKVSLGREMSLEAREKLRQANLGRPGYWAGKKRSAETNAKISQANRGNKGRLGQKHTPESIERMRQAKRYSPHTRHSPHTRKRMIGNKINLGRKQSPETREKISQANRGRKLSPETRARMRQTHQTPECRAKISQAVKARRRKQEQVPA